MELSRKEIIDTIRENDTARAVEMLEAFMLTKPPRVLTPGSKKLALTMLGAASAMSYRGALYNSLAEELIERTAATVELFRFISYVIIAAEIKTDKFGIDTIPEEIRKALREGICTDEIANAIEKLDKSTFAAMLVYIMTDEVKCLSVEFNLPIIRYIYTEETISQDLLFAYMGLCFHELTDNPYTILGISGGIPMHGGAINLLMMMGQDDNEDEEQEPEE